MKQEEKCRLLFGPYTPPRTRPGRFLFCERRGTVKVSDYSYALIPWPIKWKTRNSLILCGDLVKAVRQESKLAVAYHWGVCLQTVRVWRRVLGTETYNRGTRWLMRSTSRELATPRRMRRMSDLARPMSRRPKSKQWKRRMSEIARRRIARSGAIHPDRPLWTPKEDKLLGTDSDQKIGKKLGRPVVAVLKRRHAKGIPNPAPRRKLWRPEEIKLLGTRPDKEIAARLGCPVRTVVTKRFNQGIRAFF
jgi:hypothetical protein